jgi:hypothetical protein
MFLHPFSAIIEFIDRDQRELWEGILYAGGMFVVALFQTLVLQQYFKIVMVTGLSIRTAVLGIVYRKVRFIYVSLYDIVQYLFTLIIHPVDSHAFVSFYIIISYESSKNVN